ncbi:hypothetical protein F4803DRAFT_555271 [Xylaria telfairii]|nr:hypothetical protein F4803DRAFT_555271 [Xylaria telfairii]
MPAILGQWIPDTAALIASTLLVVALATVLAVNNGKPIFFWYKVTLNTIVSLLSTASKASLLLAVEDLISQWNSILFKAPRPLIDFECIDLASRGPFGSLVLVFCCRGMTYIYLRTVVVLSGLAMDPFAQQLVQNEQQLTTVDDNSSTISRAGRYSQGTRSVFEREPFSIFSDILSRGDGSTTAVAA